MALGDEGQKHTAFDSAELLTLLAENDTGGIETEGNEEDNELFAGEWDPHPSEFAGHLCLWWWH